MTRINLISPQELCDKHLIAEYREALRVRKFALQHTNRKLPSTFRLGKGHVRFFIDKGRWLKNRWHCIKDELIFRGVSPKINWSSWPGHLEGDWIPSDNDISISLSRIIEMLPEDRKWTNRPIPEYARDL